MQVVQQVHTAQQYSSMSLLHLQLALFPHFIGLKPRKHHLSDASSSRHLLSVGADSESRVVNVARRSIHVYVVGTEDEKETSAIRGILFTETLPVNASTPLGDD